MRRPATYCAVFDDKYLFAHVILSLHTTELQIDNSAGSVLVVVGDYVILFVSLRRCLIIESTVTIFGIVGR